jgi:hypothetical protein
MKKTLLAVALTAASFTAVADMSISGHANLKAGSLEDFQSGGVAAVQGNEGLTVGDANSSGSRFRIVSSTEANGITYGSKLEFGYNIDGINNRVNEVSAGGSFGKLTLGKGSIAGDGASEEDFSGTYVTSGDLSSWELGGDLAQNAKKDPGRAERLRFDAPKLGNLALSASINDGTVNDEGNDVSLAARYALSNIAVSVAAINAEADNSDQVAASIAGQMASFNAAVQYYTKESGTAGVNNDFEQMRFVVGYKTGPFSLAVDYGVTETDTKSVDAETTGLNFVYNAAKGVQLYAGARNAQANNGVEDENAFLMGARVKF